MAGGCFGRRTRRFLPRRLDRALEMARLQSRPELECGSRRPRVALPCDVLVWQYSDECHGGDGYDCNTSNPNIDFDTFIKQLICPAGNGCFLKGAGCARSCLSARSLWRRPSPERRRTRLRHARSAEQHVELLGPRTRENLLHPRRKGSAYPGRDHECSRGRAFPAGSSLRPEKWMADRAAPLLSSAEK